MTAPKKVRFWLVIPMLICLGIGLGPDPVLTEPPDAVATTQAIPLTGGDWKIDTFAGGGFGDGGPAVHAALAGPIGVAVDSSGNLFIADSDNHRIRRVDPSGTITTIAGTGEAGLSGDYGPAVRAPLYFPRGLAVDGAGNLYIADSFNNRIRRVDPSGTITSPGGTGEAGFSGDNGPAVAAQLHRPQGVAVDATGNLYVADYLNHRVRRVDPSGTITTVAGTGRAGFSGDNGPAVHAQLYYPKSVAADAAGNLYIADTTNSRIRRIDSSGTITTIAGTGQSGFEGDNGPAIEPRLAFPEGLALDAAGNLYIADTYNNRIRRVDPSGTITTVAGSGERGFRGDHGPAIAALLNRPGGVAVDALGNLYIADTGNNRIRWVNSSGFIATIAGTNSSGDNGPAVEAVMNFPSDVAVGRKGNLYIAGGISHTIRRVDTAGTITTLAGSGESGFSGDGGPAVEAQLDFPKGVALGTAGNLYIADTNNNRIRRVDPSGTITTIAGTGQSGFEGDNGPAIEARLASPEGLALDAAGNLYVADVSNHRIRRIDLSGTITTIAGTGGSRFSGDGGPAVAAQLSDPTGVAADSAGNLYIADSSNARIRRIDPSGTITTIAGSGGYGFTGNGGPAVEARLWFPQGVALDAAGNLYFADTLNHTIRRVDLSGTIDSIAGVGTFFWRGFSGDGGPAAAARLDHPRRVAVDGAGNLYIADWGNHRIRILTQTRPADTLPAPTNLTATTVSSSRINLTWHDNSDNETGFKVQRRPAGSSHWIEAGTTAANATTFSDAGLEPSTTYRYRVQAFNSAGTSTFSNEAVATTAAAAPTVSGFAPTGGPVGTGSLSPEPVFSAPPRSASTESLHPSSR